MKTRFKVTAPYVLQSALLPTAVILAAVKVPHPDARSKPPGQRPGPITLTYVLVDADERDALWRLSRDVRATPTIGDFHMSDWCVGAPPLLRTQDIDVDTGLPVGADESKGLCLGELARSVSWLSGEALWVLANNYAPPALAALLKWRAENPPSDKRIHAPNWRVATAVRKLALAAGSPDPKAGL